MSEDVGIGAVVSLDLSQFSGSVSKINQGLSLVQAQFKEASSRVGMFGDNTNALKDKVGALSDKIDLQKSKMSLLQDAYNKSASETGKDSDQTNILAKSLLNAQSSLNKMNSDLEKTTKELNDQPSKWSKLSGSMSDMNSKSSKVSDGFNSIKNAISGVAIAAIAGFSLKSVVDEMDSEEKATAQMGAVLKSTGDASGMTKQQLESLADAQSKVTTNSKDTTMQAENMLLTFTGVGSKVFPQATIAAEDMATALGTSASGAAKMLGKALNDPAAGLSKLTRLGVTFTAAQKEQIVAMEKAGNVAGAQGFILDTLSKKYGGSAVAAGSTFSGSIQIMTNNLKESGASILSSLMPVATSMMPMLVNAAQSIASEINAHKIEIIGAVTSIAGTIRGIFGFVESHGALIKGAIIGIVGAMVAWKAATLASIAVQEIQNTIAVISALATGGAAAAKDVLTGATEAGTSAQMANNIAMLAGMWPILAIVAAVALLAVGVYELIKNWSTVSTFFVDLWKTVSAAFVDAWHGIEGFFSGVWSWMTGFFEKWYPEILGVLFPFLLIPLLIFQHWGQISTFLSKLWSDVIGVAAAFGNKMESVIMAPFTFISNFIHAFRESWDNGFTEMQTGPETFAAHLASIIQGIVSNIKNFLINLVAAFTPTINAVTDIFNKMKSIIMTVFDVIKMIVLGAVLLICDLITGNFTKLESDAGKIFNRLGTDIKTIWNDITGTFKDVGAAILNIVTVWINGLVLIVTTSINLIMLGFTNFVKLIEIGFTNFINLIELGFTAFIKSTVSSWTNFMTAIRNLFTTGINGIVSFFTGIPAKLASISVSVGNGLRSGFNSFVSFMSGLPGKIGSLASGIGSAIKGGFNSAISFITGLPGKMLGWGKDMINGLINGIKAGIGAVGNAVKSVADKITGFLHFSIPDEGPLRDMPSWTDDMMSTYTNGITSKIPNVQAAMQKLTSGMQTSTKISANASSESAQPVSDSHNSYNVGPSTVVSQIVMDGKEIASHLTKFGQQNDWLYNRTRKTGAGASA